LPILVTLLLGMFTGGIAYNQKLAITNGVREGSRYGATLPIANSSCGTVGCWLVQVADVTQAASEGELASTATARSICVAFINATGTGSDLTTRLIRDSSGDNVQAGLTCFNDGLLNSEKRVQVTGSRQGTIEYLVGTATPTLSSQAVTRFEG
jgi:Flp pilus assembly protein TadG